ncbi:MAG: hypothetical protein IIX99_02275, partial [Oscillospiraceae bacterium]|nr:hypothetical protein [Oscillospiraceae bacterium]
MKKTFAFLLMLVLALGISVHAATLPAGFEELDYVSAAGNSYFDTELYATAATKIEAKFSYDKDGCYLYGASDNPSTVNTLSSLLKSEAEGNWRLMNGSVGLKFAHDTVYETVHDASGVTVNGTLNAFSATLSDTQKTPWTYVIGSCVNASGSPNSSAWKFSGDIYYIKISENGTLIRSFVPALRTSDSVAGLYDTVEGKFYVSEGTSDFIAPNAAPALVIDANAGIVRNAVTGEIYFAKKADLEHAMASTTKIMTALLSVEHLDLESRTLPAIASDQVGAGNTKIDLVIGEELKVKDALHGLMLPSGNDAA